MVWRSSSERTTKSIRITEDAQRFLRLVAAFEDRTEGAIVEDALAAYLQVRSLGYGRCCPRPETSRTPRRRTLAIPSRGSQARSRKRSQAATMRRSPVWLSSACASAKQHVA